MPEYKYKCKECKLEWYEKLPISTDPQGNLECEECGGVATRRIGFKPSEVRSSTRIVMKRGSTLGDWYKKETGKDLLGK